MQNLNFMNLKQEVQKKVVPETTKKFIFVIILSILNISLNLLFKQNSLSWLFEILYLLVYFVLKTN